MLERKNLLKLINYILVLNNYNYFYVDEEIGSVKFNINY